MLFYLVYRQGLFPLGVTDIKAAVLDLYCGRLVFQQLLSMSAVGGYGSNGIFNEGVLKMPIHYFQIRGQGLGTVFDCYTQHIGAFHTRVYTSTYIQYKLPSRFTPGAVCSALNAMVSWLCSRFFFSHHKICTVLSKALCFTPVSIDLLYFVCSHQSKFFRQTVPCLWMEPGLPGYSTKVSRQTHITTVSVQ